jgi:hypothetical protein
MKNQYFADRNDFFKYDLCVFLAENLPGIERFTFVPMLTADDGGGDGGKVDYPMGVGRESLYRFLRGCLMDGRREVVRLRDYFGERRFPFEYLPYGDTLEREFTHANRDSYFRQIPAVALRSAVILVDPDNGLEVKTSKPWNFHKFIRRSEARDLFDRMGRNSILVLYQHLPRVQREDYLEGLHARIREELECPDPVTVADSQIALVMIGTPRYDGGSKGWSGSISGGICCSGSDRHSASRSSYVIPTSWPPMAVPPRRSASSLRSWGFGTSSPRWAFSL